jgi:hypothetical protein
MPTTLDVETVIEPDGEALEIARNWREWVIYRDKRIAELRELRNYLFATDTTTTSNKALPWSNSTTTPKLTQIRDNLHANYMAALFPNANWMRWAARSQDDNTLEKRNVIQGYVQTKVDDSGFEDKMSELVLDWIDTGMAFGVVEHERVLVERAPGDIIQQYVGPKLKRISIHDITFDPTAESFAKTPKIIKELVSIGDLKKRILEDPEENEWMRGAFDKMISVRGAINQLDAELSKTDAYQADGFSSFTDYFKSGRVELLHFMGDLYNSDTGEVRTNRIITIADRSRLLRDIPNPSWQGAASVRGVGWRQRPDNLYAMGPLENLVGLQYRIDHLENMKADVWDQVAHPHLLIQGDVEEFGNELGERIYLGDEGSVGYLAPDVTALAADQQIADLANKMEELAGAPRSAMGIRTPGEKTAFEVGVLDRGAARVFQHKAEHLERNFAEPLLNDYLEVGRRNLDESDVVRTQDDDTGALLFQTITREDITGNGKVVPMGSRHFAERALRLQNLQQLWQLKLADPSVGVHFSGKLFAKLLAQELGEENLFSDNVSVFEQTDTQRIIAESQIQTEEQQLAAIDEGV